MPPVHAYILAGGRSSRFGSDKARATIGGVPLIQRIAIAAGEVCTEVTVIANVADKYADLGLRTIADRQPGAGPLAGLEAALHDAAERGEALIFLASCDLVELKPAWIRRLVAAHEPSAQFVAFRGQFWEPLVACYHVSLLPEIERRLARNDGSVWQLIAASEGIALSLPADWPTRIQANSPAELHAATRGLGTASPSISAT